jgi:hypothetical protein
MNGSEAARTVLDHPDGSVTVTALPEGRRRVTVEAHDPSIFVSRASCETAYSSELIAAVLEVKGIGFLCDEIARDEDPRYVENALRYSLLSYLPEAPSRASACSTSDPGREPRPPCSRGCCRARS